MSTMGKSCTRSVLARSCMGALLGSALALPVVAADMTPERALNVDKEPQNWLLHHQNYQGHRFSTLDQINLDTVKNLKLAFTVGIGGVESGGRYPHGNLEATPLVEDGIMYTTDGWGSVYAIDVSSGKKGVIKWKTDPGTDRAWAGDVACCGVNNRGVALWKDQIVSAVLDGRVMAMKKDTGEVLWERKVADPNIAETLTLSPLVIGDLVIVGAAGAEFGIRGWLDATDLNTGKQAWRTQLIPGKGEPGNETWIGEHDPWLHGGASIWVTGTYDAETGLMYWGTGNPGPDWDSEYRPGDNLWTSSVVALEPKTGKLKWGFQYTPNDPYDYDEIGEHPLIDVDFNGEKRKLIIHAARNGFYYGLDRTNGQFLVAKQYVNELTWTTGIDPKTGKPLSYNPAEKVQTYVPGSHGTRANPEGRACPSIVGGKNWQPSAYNPVLNLFYIPSIEGCNVIETKVQDHFEDKGGKIKWRERFTGGGTKWPERPTGAIKAVDPVTGEIKAKIDLHYPNYSGVLATAGNLVFTGHYDGAVTAHDAKTLKEVWSFNLGTGINAPPMTYSVDGKQYIAVMVGSRMSATILNSSPELRNNATASMLAVFAL